MSEGSQHLTICENVEEVLHDLKSGSIVMVGGFGLSGIPENIIEHVRGLSSITDLRVISSEAGDDDWGLGRLIEKRKISKQWASYIGRCKAFEHAYLNGDMEVELIPQGTLAEKIRCAGAGIPAFYSITGIHTLYGDGRLPKKYRKDGSVESYNKKRETRDFSGKTYLLEEAFPIADFAWIKARKVDKSGNCVFKGTGQNFNGIMGKEIVETGDLKPEEIHLSGLYVNRIFKGAKFEHKIEILKFSNEGSGLKEDGAEGARETIARRAAKEFVNGMNCNLGVGIPTLAAAYAGELGVKVHLQSENGMMGVGPYPRKGEEDSDWINAGKESVTPLPGASAFGSDESFLQVRGGHLDMTVLGALECSQYGDLANFMIPGKMVKGMGGAMDLVSNPQSTKVLVVQTHTDKHGKPKIKKECKLPLTGARCVHTIITELAVFDVDHEKGLTLREYHPKTSIDEIMEKTEAEFTVGGNCRAWEV